MHIFTQEQVRSIFITELLDQVMKSGLHFNKYMN